MNVADKSGKATRIELANFSSPQMRAFHMSWIAFFICFFAWFGIAPLDEGGAQTRWRSRGASRLVHHRFRGGDDCGAADCRMAVRPYGVRG